MPGLEKSPKKFKAFNTLAHLNLLYMHWFSWRMATVQMRLMLHNELGGVNVNHHGLFIQPNITLLILFTKAVWSHLLSSHNASALIPFFVYVCPFNVCCAFTLSVTELPPLCVYIQCLLRKKVVMRIVLLQIEHLPRCPCSLCCLFYPPPSYVLLINSDSSHAVLNLAFQRIRLAIFFSC